MKKIFLVAAFLAVMGLGVGKADASIVTSTATANGSGAILMAAPSSGMLYLKGCVLGNNNASAVCITLVDGGSSNASIITMCVADSSTYVLGGGGGAANTQSATTVGNLPAIFGEQVPFVGPIYALASATQSGTLLTCSVLNQ